MKADANIVALVIAEDFDRARLYSGWPFDRSHEEIMKRADDERWPDSAPMTHRYAELYKESLAPPVLTDADLAKSLRQGLAQANASAVLLRARKYDVLFYLPDFQKRADATIEKTIAL
jgi:hypothetical protein